MHAAARRPLLFARRCARVQQQQQASAEEAGVAPAELRCGTAARARCRYARACPLPPRRMPPLRLSSQGLARGGVTLPLVLAALHLCQGALWSFWHAHAADGASRAQRYRAHMHTAPAAAAGQGAAAERTCCSVPLAEGEEARRAPARAGDVAAALRGCRLSSRARAAGGTCTARAPHAAARRGGRPSPSLLSITITPCPASSPLSQPTARRSVSLSPSSLSHSPHPAPSRRP